MERSRRRFVLMEGREGKKEMGRGCRLPVHVARGGGRAHVEGKEVLLWCGVLCGQGGERFSACNLGNGEKCGRIVVECCFRFLEEERAFHGRKKEAFTWRGEGREPVCCGSITWLEGRKRRAGGAVMENRGRWGCAGLVYGGGKEEKLVVLPIGLKQEQGCSHWFSRRRRTGLHGRLGGEQLLSKESRAAAHGLKKKGKGELPFTSQEEEGKSFVLSFERKTGDAWLGWAWKKEEERERKERSFFDLLPYLSPYFLPVLCLSSPPRLGSHHSIL